MGQPKKKTGFGKSDLIYFNPDDSDRDLNEGLKQKILQFPALIKHPQITNFCEVLIHRYLTNGERSWLLIGDGSEADRHLQLLVAAIAQNLLLQVHEKIAIVMLDEGTDDYISRFFHTFPNESRFPSNRKSIDDIVNLPNTENMSIFEKQERVAFWPVSKQLQSGAKSVAESRENFSNLANNFDFIIIFSSTFGEEEKSYSDPVRLQAVWNVDRAYFMTEVGSSRASQIKRQMELVKFLGLKQGEGLLWKSKWLEQASNALFGKKPNKEIKESIFNKILRFKK